MRRKSILGQVQISLNSQAQDFGPHHGQVFVGNSFFPESSSSWFYKKEGLRCRFYEFSSVHYCSHNRNYRFKGRLLTGDPGENQMLATSSPPPTANVTYLLSGRAYEQNVHDKKRRGLLCSAALFLSSYQEQLSDDQKENSILYKEQLFNFFKQFQFSYYNELITYLTSVKKRMIKYFKCN